LRLVAPLIRGCDMAQPEKKDLLDENLEITRLIVRTQTEILALHRRIKDTHMAISMARKRGFKVVI